MGIGDDADAAMLGAFLATPESVAYFLAYFQIDLTDPEFHAVLLAQFVIVHAEAKKLLDNAIAVSELEPCDTGALARLIQQVNGGCMLDWAVYRKGPLDVWVRDVYKRQSYNWMFVIEDSGEHYGQLVVYYRANNMVPPESRP